MKFLLRFDDEETRSFLYTEEGTIPMAAFSFKNFADLVKQVEHQVYKDFPIYVEGPIGLVFALKEAGFIAYQVARKNHIVQFRSGSYEILG